MKFLLNGQDLLPPLPPQEVEWEVGDVATVWDGGMAGMATKVKRETKVLILADSKAAVAAVKKAGRTGKAKSSHLQRTVNMIAEVRKKKCGGGQARVDKRSHRHPRE